MIYNKRKKEIYKERKKSESPVFMILFFLEFFYQFYQLQA